ncbi:HDOD domain-containing protein [Sulfidibacter corallicola]|uniref:HDOD domain-containing protein n=1 Tax=Sulfidibacter corallicola TaxID=2818388 RepID=A0A8A4TVM3_SULCO|nr:HDOD domain-containing protein [Sulfidibacter corallicola]QTD53218.1 HDOD domain-containing protein [Sulfidibacter corallicola]
MERVERRIFIQKINNLPTLPTIIHRIIQVADSANANATTLGKVLSKDQSISSLILRLVNSAFYGKVRNISSINHAAVILGFPMVKTIAMGVSVFHTNTKPSAEGFDRRRFWLHSLGVATLAKTLAKKLKLLPHLDSDTVFLSGLLHDLGKVVFDNYFHEEYLEVARLVQAEQLWIGHAERRILEMDHTEAGYYLARKWQFPAPVVAAIRHHHDIPAAENQHRPLCALVQAADYGCRKIHLGSGGDDVEVELDPLARDRYGLTDRVLEPALADLEKRREELEAFVSG